MLKESWCCSHPAFIYSLLSLQFVQHRLSAEDIIDVSLREMAADWCWRSIPLHLACVVSTWLSLRQMLWEIIWRWDEKGWASGREIELITLTCIQLHGRTGSARILSWTSGGTWACQAGFCHCDAYINRCSHGLSGYRWIWQQRSSDGGDTGQWPVYWWRASLITATEEVTWLSQFAFLKQDFSRFEKLWMDLNHSLLLW